MGCGRVTETLYLPALRSLGSRVEVHAVADIDPHRGRRVADAFGVPRVFSGVESMLAGCAARLDAIAVCTPAAFHADAVIAALRDGKHVLVEKPVALSLDDADRMIAQAERAPGLRVMVGFNLRHHRLIGKAKRLLASGVLGDMQLIRTTYTSGIRHGGVPGWRDRRQSGGGVLAEVGIHHIDLLRYLTSDEIVDVFAETIHGEGDDEAAALTLRLARGATASCVFSERTADANELEFFGPKGRLALSLYRFDSLVLTPPHRHGGRARQLLRTFREVPEAWPNLRRGGDLRETYRAEWIAFIEAIRTGRPVPATLVDGRAALQIVLAAGASAGARRPVAVADGPRAPQALRAPARAVQEPSGAVDAPRLSAILATRDGFETIRATVAALRAQTVRADIELLVVCPRGDRLGLDPDAVRGFRRCRVIEVGPVTSIARANAAGVRAASAPVVVFCEDHAFPDPEWADALLAAHRAPYAAVGPAVRNANPGTAVSWADCLIGYGPWLEPVAAGEASHLPGHNSSYKREILLGYGQRLDQMLDAETVLHWDLRARGHRLYLEASARLAHTNFARLRTWTTVQFHAGRVFAAKRAAGWGRGRRGLFALAAPVIPVVRLLRHARDARRVAAREPIPARAFAALLWGLAMDGLGQLAGYALGAGRSGERIAEFEFNRIAHVKDRPQVPGGGHAAAQRGVDAG